ncbi:cell wall hydrolase [Clostridium acetobutylicum]|nr:cell wall hydrolase [Clostridium acetobutylicum]
MKGILKYKRSIVLSLAVLISYLSIYVWLLPYNNAVNAITYKYGSNGSGVIQIQTKLKNWGYYTGKVDGVYGYQTYTAVKKFQTKNGILPDGIVGTATSAALGMTTTQPTVASSSYSSYNQNVTLLARLINGEARGEPYAGQVAVGATVINRTKNPKFPSTIAGVIYQPGAFTAIVDGQIHATMEPSSIRAARDALNGWDPSGGAIYYFNPATATSGWIWSRPLIIIIGKHRFCR